MQGTAAGTQMGYQQFCQLHSLDRAAQRLQGLRLLLQQKLDAVSRLQAKALLKFRGYQRSSLQDIAAGAAASVFADGYDCRTPAVDSDGEDSVCSEGGYDDNIMGEAADEQSGPANGDGQGTGINTGSPDPPMPAVVLQPINQWTAFEGPDTVLHGPLRPQHWNGQLPPWQATEDVVISFRGWHEAGVWPAQLAALQAPGGIITLPNLSQLAATDVERLEPGAWLNDELVNYAMWLLQQRDACMQGLPPCPQVAQWSGSPGVSCHFFSSFFMAKLYLDAFDQRQCRAGEISYTAVCRWTRPNKLKAAGQPKYGTGVLSCSLLIAPCNLEQRHWTLVVADLERRRILYLDSKGGHRMDIADAMASYVQAEAYHKRQERWDTDSWPRLFPEVPRQLDGCSCGLYAVVFADCIGLGAPLQHCGLSDDNVNDARANMLAAICRGVL